MPPQQNVWTCEHHAELQGSERAWPGQTQRLAGRSPPDCGSQKIAKSCKFNPYNGYLGPSMVQVLWILNDTESFKCEQLRFEFGSSSSMVTEVKPPKGANTNLRGTSQGHTSIASILMCDCIYIIAGKFHSTYTGTTEGARPFRVFGIGPEGWCRFSKLIFWLWQLAEITTFSTSSLSSLQSLDSPIYLQAQVARQPRVQEKATTEQSAATALGSQNHPQVLDISRYYLDITENIMNETHI